MSQWLKLTLIIFNWQSGEINKIPILLFSFQLNNLEKKWSHLEQNNFAIEEFVANKKAEMNFELVKNKVLKMQWTYNRMLIENVKNLTTAPSTAY